MWLAALMGEHPAELRADFRQYYHVSADEIGNSLSVSEAADLAAMLPLRSRCLNAVNPSTSWDIEHHLLADIADTLAYFFWSTTQDAVKGTNKPIPKVRPGADLLSASGSKGYTVDECTEILNKKRT